MSAPENRPLARVMQALAVQVPPNEMSAMLELSMFAVLSLLRLPIAVAQFVVGRLCIAQCVDPERCEIMTCRLVPSASRVPFLVLNAMSMLLGALRFLEQCPVFSALVNGALLVPLSAMLKANLWPGLLFLIAPETLRSYPLVPMAMAPALQEPLFIAIPVSPVTLLAFVLLEMFAIWIASAMALSVLAGRRLRL